MSSRSVFRIRLVNALKQQQRTTFPDGTTSHFTTDTERNSGIELRAHRKETRANTRRKRSADTGIGISLLHGCPSVPYTLLKFSHSLSRNNRSRTQHVRTVVNNDRRGQSPNYRRVLAKRSLLYAWRVSEALLRSLCRTSCRVRWTGSWLGWCSGGCRPDGEE